MKRNFILSIFMIITLLIANISFAAETPKAELTITANKTKIENTDKTIEITITLGNISGLATTGNNVFLAYEGTIEYDTNMFEAVTVKGQNDWSATYGPTTKKIIGDTDNAKANTIIAKLIFTLKDSIAEGKTGTIKLNEMKLTDGKNKFTFNKTITVTNKKEGQGQGQEQDKNQDDENQGDKNQGDKNGVENDNNISDNDEKKAIDKVQSKDNNVADSSQAKGSIPKAGLKNIIVLAALMIVITGIFSFARYKMIKLK